ncbi:hypothetical protein Ancab_017619 [Ancistrocladus abbreviatus]
MPRESDSKRHRSKFDREPSPKRSQRDAKLATERSPRRVGTEVGGKDEDQKQRRWLQDVLPLEPPPVSHSKVEAKDMSKESGSKANGHGERTKHSDPTIVPRSRSYFQHDERGIAGRDGRSSGRRATSERGWWRDSKDEQRTTLKTATSDVHENEEKPLAQGADYHVWRHDKFVETEADPPPPAKKRRPFREEKLPLEPESNEKAVAELTKPPQPDRLPAGSERREERGSRNLRYSDKSDRGHPYMRDRSLRNQGRGEKGSFPSRDRYNAGGSGGRYRGQDRYNGRQGYRSGGVRVEKWKHDLFDEANRSPSPKKEEDPVAKVEALLAS